MIQPRDVDLAQLEQLFDRALALDERSRTALIVELRSSRPGLARDLEELLEASSRAGDFLRDPASLELLAAGELEGGELPAQPIGRAEDLIGHVVGGFRVLALIDSGGSSDVYEAEQDRPRRRVALKVLLDAVTSPGTRARFADEAHTLARFDHPNVARVFDAGRERGPRGPFSWIAVEYIPAPSFVTDFADRAGLDLAQRVRLALPICDAVHHAHLKGVLHRDLKPANLLVAGDGSGTPKVIDFGLARLLEPLAGEAQQRTRSGELLGTLRYMSPEQCSGAPDQHEVRTDVYALGVVLYELLTGELPYALEGRSLLEILEIVRRTPARDPAALRPALSGDLAAVLLQALEKDPEQRYDSVAALRDDLERWLRHEPVLARRPTLLHRVRLFARRRTGLFAGLTAGAAAGLVAVVAITALFFANRSGLRDLRAAEERNARQEAQVARAREDLVELQGRLDGLMELSGDPDAALAQALVREAAEQRRVAETPEDRRRAVGEAVARLALLAPLLAEDPASAASLARAFVKVGNLHGAEWNAAADDARAGLEAYERALALWRRVVAARPDDALAAGELIDTLVRITDAHRKVRTPADGSTLADEAVLLARRAVERRPLESGAVERLIEAYWARGDLHIELEPFELGLSDTRAALEWAERLLEQREFDARSTSFAAWTLMRLGIWVDRLGRDPRAASAHHRRAVDLLAAVIANPATPRSALSDPAHELYNVMAWNDLHFMKQVTSDEEFAARLTELLEVARHLEGLPVLVDVLPMLTWMTAELRRVEGASAAAADRRDLLFEQYAALGPAETARALDGVAGLLEPAEGDGGALVELCGALRERFGAGDENPER